MKLLAGVLAVGMGLCAPSSLAAAELRLLMFEQPGCQYCAQWTEEIAPQYPLTDEGRAAPVERVKLRAPLAEGITLTSPPVFTPTFVLLRDGTEVGRIEGYPGEHFFWPLLGQLIAQATQDDP